MTATLHFKNPEWVEAQRQAIEAAKAQKNHVQEVAVKLMSTMGMTALEIFQTLIMQEHARLKRLYPDLAQKNQWFHWVLIGSSIPPELEEEKDFADFPGEDSMALFVERLQKDYPAIVAKLSEKLQTLRAKYPDCTQYNSYNLVTGFFRKSPHDDFPGEDALHPFVRELYASVVPRRAQSQESPGDTSGKSDSGL